MGTGDIKSVWDRMTQLQRQFLTKLTFKHLVIKCHWKSFYSQFGRNGVSAVTSSADVLTKRMVGDRNLVYKSNTKQGFVSTFDLFILHVNMRQLHYLKLGKSHTDEGFWHSNSISSKETKKKKEGDFLKPTTLPSTHMEFCQDHSLFMMAISQTGKKQLVLLLARNARCFVFSQTLTPYSFFSMNIQITSRKKKDIKRVKKSTCRKHLWTAAAISRNITLYIPGED